MNRVHNAQLPSFFKAAFMITREEFPNLSGLDDARLSNPMSHKPPFRFGTIPNGATDYVLKNNFPNTHQYMKKYFEKLFVPFSNIGLLLKILGLLGSIGNRSKRDLKRWKATNLKLSSTTPQCLNTWLDKMMNVTSWLLGVGMQWQVSELMISSYGGEWWCREPHQKQSWNFQFCICLKKSLVTRFRLWCGFSQKFHVDTKV